MQWAQAFVHVVKELHLDKYALGLVIGVGVLFVLKWYFQSKKVTD